MNSIVKDVTILVVIIPDVSGMYIINVNYESYDSEQIANH